MPEKINIASLQIDFDQVIKKSAEFKKTIDDLKEAQKGLDKTTEEGRQAFASNEVQIKNLGKAYRDNQAFAAALDAVNKDLTKTMSSENKSTQELRDSRSQLNQISKQLERSEGELTGNIEEERALRNKLNLAIDQQTEALRIQSSEFNSSKDQIGEYEKNIRRALETFEKSKNSLNEEKELLVALRDEQEKGSETWNFYNTQINQTNTQINVLIQNFGGLNNEMNASSAATKLLKGDLSGLAEESKKAGGAGVYFKSVLKGVVSGVWSMIKASLAFIATPVGALLALLVGGFLLVKNAMDRSEEATNKIKKAFSAFGGIITAVLKFLQPLGDFLINGLVKGLQLVEIGVFKAMEGIAKGLELLGFKETAAEFRAFTNEIKLNAAASKELVQAEFDLQKAQRASQKIQLDFQKQAEKLRQGRDNENLSIKERIALNDDLGAVLKDQLKEELKIAEMALHVANLRIVAEGQTKEALDAQAEALTVISEIQERITGKESEQLKAKVSLQKEGADNAKAAADKMKKIADDAIKTQNEALDLFIQQQGRKAKTLKESLEVEREISKRSIEILDAELKNKNISQTKYDAELLKIKEDLLQKQAELSVDNARRDLENYIQVNASKLENEQYLTEAIFEEERLRLERIAEQRRIFEAKRLEEGVIDQQTYNDRINEINEENRLSNLELEAQRKEEKKAAEAVDRENQLLIEEEYYQNALVTKQERLDGQRAQELAAAEKSGADKALINRKYDELDKTMARQLFEFKAATQQATLDGLANLFGESNDLGKAFSIAAITQDSILKASQAFTQAAAFAANPITLPLAANANIQGITILATGVAQAAKVSGLKFERGGILKGKRHAQGGVKLANGDEGEGGEAIINRKSTSMFAPLLSQINEAGGGVRFAGGGISGATSQPREGLDLDLLAFKISEANKSLPSPVVSVEEFTSVRKGLTNIEEAATF